MNATTKTETNEPSPTTDDCAECERTRDAKNDACIAYKDATYATYATAAARAAAIADADRAAHAAQAAHWAHCVTHGGA